MPRTDDGLMSFIWIGAGVNLKVGEFQLNVKVESEKNGVFCFRYASARHREEPELLASVKRCGWAYPVLVFSV